MAWHSTSSASRGYGYEWQRLRKLVLQRDNGLCQCKHCKTAGRVTIATEVDHVVNKAEAKRRGWTDEQIDDPSNLASINADCHKRKTVEENGGEYRPRQRIGPDGYPID